MKTFKLNIKAFATIIVDAETEEDAYECTDDVDFGDLTMDEAQATELKGSPYEIEREKIHAEKVFVVRSSVRQTVK